MSNQAPARQSGPGSAALAPPRAVGTRQRRPLMIVVCVALIAFGGLGGALLYLSSGQREPVLVLARDVSAGQTLTAGDLTDKRIAADPGIKLVPAGQEHRIVGKRAAQDLSAGSLLAPSQVTSKSLVGIGQQLVGVGVKTTEMPSSLHPGDAVKVVTALGDDAADTSGADTGSKAQGGQQQAPATVDATVVKVGKADANGLRSVDLAVDASQGAKVAALGAAGHIALVASGKS